MEGKTSKRAGRPNSISVGTAVASVRSVKSTLSLRNTLLMRVDLPTLNWPITATLYFSRARRSCSPWRICCCGTKLSSPMSLTASVTSFCMIRCSFLHCFPKAFWDCGVLEPQIRWVRSPPRCQGGMLKSQRGRTPSTRGTARLCLSTTAFMQVAYSSVLRSSTPFTSQCDVQKQAQGTA